MNKKITVKKNDARSPERNIKIIVKKINNWFNL
jgi:hypothetical protein